MFIKQPLIDFIYRRLFSSFFMITLQLALIEARQILKTAGISSYLLDSRILLEYVTGKTREFITGYPETPLAFDDAKTYQILIARRAAHEPVSHLTGKREFWGREFNVTADTLDPRPDSETLIEQALNYFPDRAAPLRILDLGTGTGCLLLTLLAEFPHATGIGVDRHFPALKVAYRNSYNLALEKRGRFILEYWGSGIDGTFDLIISNPPYIKSADLTVLQPEVFLYEPHIALEGGMDGLVCYHALMPDISRLLAEDGYAVLEFGCGQENALSEILVTHHLQPLSYGKDLAGITRCVVAQKFKE